MAERSEGWAWPHGAAKNHYIVDGRALCGKWLTLGNTEAREYSPHVDCAICERRRARRQEQLRQGQRR